MDRGKRANARRYEAEDFDFDDKVGEETKRSNLRQRKVKKEKSEPQNVLLISKTRSESKRQPKSDPR